MPLVCLKLCIYGTSIVRFHQSEQSISRISGPMRVDDSAGRHVRPGRRHGTPNKLLMSCLNFSSPGTVARLAVFSLCFN